MTFYDISPKVIEIERRESTFLRDPPAKIDVSSVTAAWAWKGN